MNNDFTKEELELILDNPFFSQTHRNLGNKIQSMIDNYCKNYGHVYEYSLGPGYCENCGEKEC